MSLISQRCTQADASSVTIDFNAQDCSIKIEDILVNADAKKLSQVIRNVLSNALKFSPPQSTVAVRCSIQGDVASSKSATSKRIGLLSSMVRIEVTDHGPGISLVSDRIASYSNKCLNRNI
jgi:signal transduction histidine kinase